MQSIAVFRLEKMSGAGRRAALTGYQVGDPQGGWYQPIAAITPEAPDMERGRTSGALGLTDRQISRAGYLTM
jgi:hypothetical protein